MVQDVVLWRFSGLPLRWDPVRGPGVIHVCEHAQVGSGCTDEVRTHACAVHFLLVVFLQPPPSARCTCRSTELVVPVTRVNQGLTPRSTERSTHIVFHASADCDFIGCTSAVTLRFFGEHQLMMIFMS